MVLINRSIVILAICILSLGMSSCGFYKFSGTSIPAEVESFSVAFFENNASIVSPLLSQILSEKLKQKFISETNLSIEETNGDFAFSGEITGYTVAPVTAQSNDNADLNRLTISMTIKMESEVSPTNSFEHSFTNFQDFDASTDFSSVEDDLIDEISDMLIQSIFNKAAINW